MPSLVTSAFKEWTSGLDTQQSMISIFEHIRDIPYSFAVPRGDPVSGPEGMLRAGRGNCGPKHYLLAEMYRRLNLSVVYATIAFSWNDPDLHYPPRIRELAASVPISHHLACRVQIGCRWVFVDATWDRPLVRAGFPVNEHWDGRADTKCAVKPLRSPVRTAFCRTLKNEPCRTRDESELCPVDGEKDHWDAEDESRYYREKVSVRTPDERERIARFYHDFDAWLERVREEARASG
jgi:transglutaminase-like putative cysteine protease